MDKPEEQPNILTEIFDNDKVSHQDNIAIQVWIDGQKKTMTYKELQNKSQKGVLALLRAGIEPGDRVILLSESRSMEWVTALFSIWQMNATAVLLDASLSAQDFKELISRSDARAVVTTPHIFQLLENSRTIPFLNVENNLEPIPGSVLKLNPTMPPTSDRDPFLACLIFTSGTTGTPQGVMLSHQNILFVAKQSIAIADLKPSDQILGLLPLNHVFGLVNVFLCSLLAGATVTFVEKIRSEDILLTMKRAGVTTLPATPRILDLFYRQINQKIDNRGMGLKFTLRALLKLCGKIRSTGLGNPGLKLFPAIHKAFGGHLVRIISGAAPLPHNIFQHFEQIGWTVVEGYGLTETAGIVAGNTMKHRVPGSVGHPVPGVNIMIAHPNAAGEGEICISGPNVMKGYFRDPKATDEILRNAWLHTGDIGYLDREGDLIISGRIKELIVTSSGKKAMPADIESRYQQIPGISEIAVVGIKAPQQLGEEIHAAIVLNKNTGMTQQQVESLIFQRSVSIPMHLRIQQIHIVNNIPKTSTLKVKRGVLKSQLLSESRMDDAIKTDNAFGKDVFENDVLQLLAEHINGRGTGLSKPVSLTSSLQFDLGIDSLDRLEISSKLEQQCGVKIDQSNLSAIDKVDDLIALVRSAPQKDSFSPVYSAEDLPKIKGWGNKVFFAIFNSIASLIWKNKVEGVNHIPQKGPFILCANHQSYLDAFWIFANLSPELRSRACCVARKELSEQWATALLAHPVSVIPADRDGNALPAIKMSLDVLKQGRPILIFPEGNRSRSGEMRAFRRGAAYLALKAGVPVIPVLIEGGFEIFPRHRLFPKIFNWKEGKKYEVKIKFGKAIQPKDKGLFEKNEEQNFIEEIKAAIEKLRE